MSAEGIRMLMSTEAAPAWAIAAMNHAAVDIREIDEMVESRLVANPAAALQGLVRMSLRNSAMGSPNLDHAVGVRYQIWPVRGGDDDGAAA